MARDDHVSRPPHPPPKERLILSLALLWLDKNRFIPGYNALTEDLFTESSGNLIITFRWDVQLVRFIDVRRGFFHVSQALFVSSSL